MNKAIWPFLLIMFVILIGCSTMNGRTRADATAYKRVATYSISQSENTSIGRQLKRAIAENPGQSGFRIFERGSSSFIARLALVRLAEKTLDVQYYAIGDDETSHLMLKALLRAAERGVRVRMLVDSFTVGDMDESLSLINGVQNIEIRVFNPLTTRDQPYLSRFASLFTDLPQANRRMHNKSLISDNQMAIMGGRNLSSEYFDANNDMNFRDLDIITAGPVTDQLSKSFDEFWNSDNSFPIDTVHSIKVNRNKIEKLKLELEEQWNKQLANPDTRKRVSITLAELMDDPETSLVWARGALSADDPEKITAPVEPSESEPLGSLLQILDKAKSEFLVISAYFVPKDEGVEWLRGLEERGVHVRILTNSLASTDVVAVHSGYEPYREALLKHGLELYELRPVNEKPARQRLLGRSQPPRAGLHSKAYVIDRRYTVIGSFNLDPRSVELNTEMSLVVDSPELSAQMVRMFEKTVDPSVSYHLRLNPQSGRLMWLSKEEGKSLKYDNEPHAGFWRRMQNAVFSVLPVEDHL